MLKKLNIKRLIILGFSVLGMLFLVFSVFSFWLVDKLVYGKRVAENSSQVLGDMLMARRNEKDFLMRNDLKYYKKNLEVLPELRQHIQILERIEDDEAEGRKLQGLLKSVDGYETLFKQVVELRKEQGLDEKSGLYGQLRDAIHAAERDIANENLVLQNSMLMLRRHEKDYMLRGEKKYLQEFAQEIRRFKRLIRTHTKGGNYETHMRNVLAYEKIFQNFVAKQDEIDGKIEEFRQNIHQIEPVIEGYREYVEKNDRVDTLEQQGRIIIIVAIILGLVIAIIASLVLIRAIIEPVKAAVQSLTDNSGQVASGADQVNAASQKLAEGSSEQASSVEEISASLEQIASMTRNNLTISEKAREVALQTENIVELANGSMRELKGAMVELTGTNEETARIIKLIDEIAFQTNLLALNAAVEAARAGKAGSGFAVVASEVKELANRSAEAARNTAELIENSVKRIEKSFTLSEKSEGDFSNVSKNIADLRDVIQQVASASNEQALAIEQINTSMSGIGTVTQGIASSSEESAAASEELNSQAEAMLDVVRELIKLVGEESLLNGRHDADRKRRKLLLASQSAPATHTVRGEDVIRIEEKF